MSQNQGAVKERSKVGVKEPSRYNVIFHNDDVTPMDYVVMILRHIFYKSGEDAVKLMLKVHNQGSAIVGCYSYDMAKTKLEAVHETNQEYGYSLKVTAEEV